jgi:DNA-binding response OmpR family regulator
MADKILLVDDDLDTLKLVGLMLERQGYEVHAASSGSQALGILEKTMPDMILLDIMMPEMDGYEVARRVRANPRTADIPIIMFTAKGQVDDKVMGFEVGADDYLTKPTQPRELIAHIKAVLSRSKKTPSPPAPPADTGRGYLIGILGVKGGLGLSTLAINLGISLYQQYKKNVIVTDFRPGQGTIGLELGESKPESLSHLLQRKSSEITSQDVKNQLTLHETGVQLLLASHHPQNAQYLSNTGVFQSIAKYLPSLARYTIVDLGPSLTPVTNKVIGECDQLIIVVEPVPHILEQTKELIEDLIDIGVGEGQINLVLVNRIRSGVQLSWSQVQEQMDREISVIFTPAPELAYQASIHNIPIIIMQPDSLTSQQFRNLAEALYKRLPQPAT